ncbi:MAG: GtrA family protein [Aphanocapsa lilacina HA4352-LM1]|nr:GtrA family protein [Aphanocapsa lilacina HA4352-LM1]
MSSYFFNARWTFREQFQASDRCAGRALGRFLVVSGVCLALNTATFALVFSGWQASR